ncbi:hypothetical protein GCM10009765_60340 [Fodinicola feengrottensis]|uniref:Uncharacterized protein n=1 Tax=Fodinicola feengrottensis TaxID=435914 RepID=A0ABP4UGB0_9ACTN
MVQNSVAVLFKGDTRCRDAIRDVYRAAVSTMLRNVVRHSSTTAHTGRIRQRRHDDVARSGTPTIRMVRSHQPAAYAPTARPDIAVSGR